jgi:SAM-dependent methyltransferase
MRFVDRLRRLVPGLPFAEPPLSRAFGSWAEWQALPVDAREKINAQFRLQSEVAQAAGADGWPGWCGLCQTPVRFDLPSHAAGALANLREEMVCPSCRLTARNRAALALVCAGQELATARIYLTEQASPGFVWLQSRCPHLEGSEFGLDESTRAKLQAWFEGLGGSGTLVERDVTRLDFAEASLDAIGSFDVLEHVPDYPAALREFARCLKPGGRLVLTLPFVEVWPETLVRARLRADGSIEHLHEPEIHGDPVSGGVLCFYHFGWDLLDALRAAGFRDAKWHRVWSAREGLFGLWTLVAQR